MESEETLSEVQYRLIEEQEIPQAARIYSEAFDKAKVGEEWTAQSAEIFLRWWFQRQPDLFFVATQGENIAGGVVAGIKPWWNGNHLVDGELFVNPKFQGKGIARELMKKLVQAGIEKYNVVDFEGVADSQAEFPIRWYERLGIKRNRWAYISDDARELLQNLTSS